MCMKPTPVVLAQDTTLQSERSGSKRIYWAAESTYTAFREGTALDVEWFVHSQLNHPTTSLYAQISADGKAWEDVPVPDADAGLLSGLITATDAGSRGQTTIWMGHLLSNASFVRFGIQVEDAGLLTQTEITLTLKVTPRLAGGTVAVANDAQPGTVTSDTALGPVIDVTDAKTLNFWVSATGLGPAGTSYKFDVKTAPTADATEWLDTGLTFTVTEGATTSGTMSGDAVAFSNYAQVFVDDTSDATAGDVYMYATVRPNC